MSAAVRQHIHQATNINRVKWPNNELFGPDLNKLIFTFYPERRLLVESFNCPTCTKKD